MAATMTIRLTSAGVDTGNVNIYTNADGYTAVLESTTTAVLTGPFGLTNVALPSGATIVRIQNVGVCTNYEDITITF
jgi:hypothetical protein